MNHGVPSARKFKSGDWVNLDLTLFKNGFFGDTSIMVRVGEVLPSIEHLIKTTENCLMEAIGVCRPGVKISKIGETISLLKQRDCAEGRTAC